MDKKRNVYLMYIIALLQGFVFYGPVATLYRQSRGISMYDIFLIESISWILMIVFEIPWGWVADRIGYKKTLIISNFIYFVSKIVFYKAYSFNMFLVERILLSVSLSGLSGCDIAMLYSSVEEKEAEKSIGIYSAMSTAGFMLASLLSTVLISKSIDYAALFTIYPYGLAVVFTFFLEDVKTQKVAKQKLLGSIKAAFKNKQIIMLVITAALAREVVQASSVFLNQAQYLRSGISIKYFGLLTAAMQIVRLSAAKSHMISSKFGKDRSMLMFYIIIALQCLVLIFTDSAAISIFSILLMSGCMALAEPIAMNMQNKSIITGDRATILSIYAMVGDLIGAAFNPVIGRTADISVEAAFTTCFIICIFICLIFLVYKRMMRKAANELA